MWKSKPKFAFRFGPSLFAANSGQAELIDDSMIPSLFRAGRFKAPDAADTKRQRRAQGPAGRVLQLDVPSGYVLFNHAISSNIFLDHLISSTETENHVAI